MSRFEGDIRRTAWSVAAALLLALILAPPATAVDEASVGDSSSESDDAKAADPTVPLTPDGGEPYPQLHVPDDGWRYVTDYFFALTLGLEKERIADWVRYTAMVGTVPADLLTSPGAALAGLFGP